ncbi:MAG: type VI secretion system membrane subunit TssM [Gammaproteobacteria bacterium]|nr:type VI secretion system membrane subunit TssM [Gammaproteobacteria bacterium]
MKNIIKILTNPLLLSIVGLIALAVMVWFGGPMIGFNESKPLESEMSRLVTILIITILWGLNNFRVQNREKKKDAEMMGDIASSGNDQPSAEDSRTSQEASIIQKHFQDALAVLKASKKHGIQGNTQPIHELPWYIIIGPPGSGKTTALINSGLRFPLADKMGQQPLKGIGGTRNCDWWFSDEAILVDTAGRYTTQDSDESTDSAGWKNFLNLLKKHRPKQPINGAIVTISLSELLLQTEAERQQHANRIKSRLSELYDNLGIQFPVYVLLTKADLVAGFNEYFDNLSTHERQQIWGTTFQTSATFESRFDLSLFKNEWDALLRRLNDRLQWRMLEERDLSRRALILGFPSEIAALKEMTSQFLDAAFKPSNFDKSVNLRGIYFTSGTQEGTPIDRVMGSLASNFGLNRQTIPAYSGQGKSFFLTNLFRNVIFPESMLAGTNRTHEQKQTWMRHGAYAAAFLATITSAGIWTSQYADINSQINAMDEHIEAYYSTTENVSEVDQSPVLLLPALEAIAAAQKSASEDTRSLFSQSGLSQMRSLGPASDEAYLRILENGFFPRIVSVLESTLTDRNSSSDTLFITLKAYLMLANSNRLENEFIQKWFENYWELQFPGDGAKQEALNTHLNKTLDKGFEPILLDQRVVKNARFILQKVPLAERIYASIKQQGDNVLDVFFLTSLIDTDAHPYFINKDNEEEPLNGIPGLFTKNGYESFFMEESIQRSKESTKDDWVYGQSENPEKTKINPDVLHKNIEQLYIAEFIKHWTKLYSNIKIASFNNFEQGIEMMEVLAGRNSALLSALDAININTDLRNKPNALQKLGGNLSKLGKFGKKAAKTKAAKSDIPLTPVGISLRKHFTKLIELSETVDGKPPGITRHLTSLIKLQEYLGALATAPEPDSAAHQASITRLKSNGKDIIGKLQRDSKRLPAPINTWVTAITQSSWKNMLHASRRHINGQWDNVVLDKYNQSIKNRYPIYKSSSQQTSLEDFSDFFAPDGIYQSFIKQNITPFLKITSRSWRLKSLEGNNIGFSNRSLQQLRRGDKISNAFFPKGAESISVKFQLKPSHLDAKVKRFEMRLDDEKVTYRHGPTRTTSHKWPFTDDPQSSRVNIRFETSGSKTEVKKKGTWAFFQLLDASKVKTTGSADKFKVTFSVDDGYTAKYELKANSTTNPFNLSNVHAFRCPTKL